MFKRSWAAMSCGWTTDAASLVVPTAAFDDKAPLWPRCCRPFKHLPGAIKDAERTGARLEAPDGQGIKWTLIVTVEARGIKGITPRKVPAVGAPNGLFPFCFRW